MTNRKPIDWEAVEREFRAGQLSVVEIGRQHGISHTAVNKRAKRDGWTRNLAGRVRQEVSARLVSDEVSTARETEAIETAAARGVQVVRQHRRDITEASRLTRALMAELDEATVQNDEILDAIEDETKGDANGRRRAAMQRAVALPSRAGVMKDLATSAKILIELERRAFNLDAAPDEDPNDAKVSARERIAGRILGIAARTAAGGDPQGSV